MPISIYSKTYGILRLRRSRVVSDRVKVGSQFPRHLSGTSLINFHFNCLTLTTPRVGSRAPGHYYHGYYRPEPKEGKERTKARSSLAIHSEGGWGSTSFMTHGPCVLLG
ncbi:hypothetical protein VNO77_49351 [Canavalia gladiata]|uniref:Uncharacterized protein n=1 Tax=Canavalia gladiata TaxID=3824 RepID=A0AAN9JGH8_CANGL